MTDENKKHARKIELVSTLKLLLAVVLAFAAALMFRQSAGILAMTPAAFIVCAAASLVGIRSLTKNVIFGITVFALNTVEQDDLTNTLIFTALCLLVCVLSDLAVKAFKKNKLRGIAVSAVSAVLCVALSIIFMGNPIAAINADKTLKSYTESKYPSNQNAALGSFEFSDIYYNFRTGAYSINAVSSEYPTEGGSITANEKQVRDSFEGVMEEKICEPYVLEITSVLRDSFPDDSFGVSYVRIASMPDEAVLSKGEKELYGAITFEITLGGVQSYPQMLKKTEQYVRALDDSEIEYASIVFKSGTDEWIRRSITVDGSRRENNFNFTVEYLPAGTSERFNRHLASVNPL